MKGIIITTKNEKKRQRTKKEQSPTETDESLFDETIPSKTQILYSLTFYHTANTILIQGNRKSIWVTIEFPLMKAIIKHKCKRNTSITDAYNQKQPHQTKSNKKMMT